MSRRPLDAYQTPAWAVDVLLERLPPLLGVVLEPCAGEGHVSNAIQRSGRADWVYTNDIDPKLDCEGAYDARQPGLYAARDWDWIISNPPFSYALPIVQQATACALAGVAMFLRLSFLEPTEDRGLWLAAHPPTKLLVLPRFSFTRNGKHDFITCAWFIWETGPAPWDFGDGGIRQQWIEVVPHRAPQPALVEVPA